MPDNTKLEDRIQSLETWRTTVDRERAVEGVRGEHSNQRFDSIEKRLDRIDSHIGRVVWLIVTAIITAAMAFLVSGGFHAS